MKELLFAYLSKTLNMDPDRLAEVLFKKSDDGQLTEDLNESAVSQLLQLDAERVSKWKTDNKTIFDNGYKKAQSEVAANWEKTLREKFGVDTENALQGESLLDAIKAAMADTQAKPDKIKVSKEYLDLENAMKKALADKDAQYKAEIEKMQSGYKKEQIWSQVAGHIRTALQGLNPVLPSDSAKADRMIDLFLTQFKDFDYEPDANGGFVILEGGERKNDDQGWAYKIEKLVEERAGMMFDFKAQEPAGNAGNQNGGAARQTNKRFASENEYLKEYNGATDSATKTALYDAWIAQSKQAN